jgi:DNA-binding NarL/FixJ family response regulator
MRDVSVFKSGARNDVTPGQGQPGDRAEPRPNPYLLTERETVILSLVAEGHADKQIAETLRISTYTVNKHVGNILGKMNAASRTEAGVRALREHLVG